MASSGMTVIRLLPISPKSNYLERAFDLVSAPVVIGRASKTESRGLRAAADNAFFECPVMSREHAELRIVFSSPARQVTITDLGSMHGTFVNNIQLRKHNPYSLHAGDLIRFGSSVSRGSGETFQGVTVQFQYLEDPPYVPQRAAAYEVPAITDDEASDVEELEEDDDCGAWDADSVVYGSEADRSPTTNTSPESKQSEAAKNPGSEDDPIEVESWPPGSLRRIVDLDTAESDPALESKTWSRPQHLAHSCDLLVPESIISPKPGDAIKPQAETQQTTSFGPSFTSQDITEVATTHQNMLRQVRADIQRLASSLSPTMHQADEYVADSCSQHDRWDEAEAKSDFHIDSEAEASDEESMDDTFVDNDSELAVDNYDGEAVFEESSMVDENTLPVVAAAPSKQATNVPFDPVRETHSTSHWAPDAFGPYRIVRPSAPNPGLPDLLCGRLDRSRFETPYPMLQPQPPSANDFWYRPAPHLPPRPARETEQHSKMAIPNIVSDHNVKEKNVGTQTVDGDPAEHTAVPVSKKRKALCQELETCSHLRTNASDDKATPAGHEASTQAAKTAIATPAQADTTNGREACDSAQEPNEHRARKRSKCGSKRGLARGSTTVLHDIGKYSLGAAVGATGAFTILASPLGGMLADWASSL